MEQVSYYNDMGLDAYRKILDILLQPSFDPSRIMPKDIIEFMYNTYSFLKNLNASGEAYTKETENKLSQYQEWDRFSIKEFRKYTDTLSDNLEKFKPVPFLHQHFFNCNEADNKDINYLGHLLTKIKQSDIQFPGLENINEQITSLLSDEKINKFMNEDGRYMLEIFKSTYFSDGYVNGTYIAYKIYLETLIKELAECYKNKRSSNRSQPTYYFY